MRRKHSLLRGFFDKGLKMHHAYGFFLRVFEANQPETPVFDVLTRQNVKNKMCLNNFHILSARASLIQETSHFWLRFFSTAHLDSSSC